MLDKPDLPCYPLQRNMFILLNDTYSHYGYRRGFMQAECIFAEETRPLERSVCRLPVSEKRFVINTNSFSKRRKTQ